MRRLRGFVVLAGLLLLASGGLYGDDKTATETPLKGRLPAYWSKLGLTDEQKQKVFKIQNEHHDKLAALEKQIKDLKDKEKADLEELLTADQKKHLRDLVATKAPPADPAKDPKTEKKPDEK